MYKVKIHTNWCTDTEAINYANAMIPSEDYTWKDLMLTDKDDYDFIAIFNSYKAGLQFDKSKAIIFQTEPMPTRRRWENEFNDNKEDYFFVYDPIEYHALDFHYNMKMKYIDFLDRRNFQKTKVMAGLVSHYTHMEGHRDRYNFFTNYLDDLPYYDHYGRSSENLSFMKSYKGELPYFTYEKQNAYLPYKYNFNCENSYEPGYFTEKIQIPILCECLCFYSGCINLENFIDSKAFIRLDLKKPDEAIEIVKDAVKSNLWEERISFILKEKMRLMNDICPLNIIWKIIHQKI